MPQGDLTANWQKAETAQRKKRQNFPTVRSLQVEMVRKTQDSAAIVKLN